MPVQPPAQFHPLHPAAQKAPSHPAAQELPSHSAPQKSPMQAFAQLSCLHFLPQPSPRHLRAHAFSPEHSFAPFFLKINKIMSGHFVERHLGKHVSCMRTRKEMPPHGMPALTFIANASRSTQVPFAPFCASVTFALKATLRRSITFHCTFFHSRIAITGWGRCADIIQELSSAYRAANVLFQSIV